VQYSRWDLCKGRRSEVGRYFKKEEKREEKKRRARADANNASWASKKRSIP
jgi:hypothetical protein